jgi:hypothetical protein
MKRKLWIPVASASLLIATLAFAGQHADGHAVSPALAPHAAPHSMAGRIIAVRRASQEITLQTADGQTHEVKVPSTAAITSHSGSHFNAVRSGQNVHLTAVNDAGHGLVARSLSIP